jgi:alpha-ketoglutarate-dependent taurine dioxygenase
MKSTETKQAGRVPFGGVTRRAVTEAARVKVKPPPAGGLGPVVLSPAVEGVDLLTWAKENRDLIEGRLLKNGAALFRGFEAGGVEGFEQFIRAVSAEPLDYRERSSPRHRVHGHVYTSTDYPAHQSIFPHNENSYQHAWPMKIFFFCRTLAESGGETPTTDTREVLRLLSPATVARFAERGCMYVRNFDGQFGLPWQTVFQTDERAAAERYCRAAGIEFEWQGRDRLRTRAVRPAVAVHPSTGERVWFNHVAFFHVSTLDPSIREGLLTTTSEEDLPANTYYGDGSSVEPEVLDEIRDAYRRATVSFNWRRGDILMLDNMLTAHSRAPYTGAREVLVGMSEPYGYGPNDSQRL